MPRIASYGAFQARVVELAALEAANVAFALQADAPTRHFVALVIRGFERAGAPLAELPRLAAALHSQPRRQLVKAWWDFDPGTGFGPALTRLGARVLGRRGYDALVAVLADPERRRILQGKSRVTEKELILLASNDPDLIEQVGFHCIAHFGAEALEWAAKGITRRVPSLSVERIAAILSKEDSDDREEALLRVFDDMKLQVPWAGTEAIQPVRSVSALRAAGRRWRNCLGDGISVWPALRGDTAHYVCHPGPAIVRLRRDRVTRSWFLEEILGPRNQSPRRAQMEVVVEAFRSAGILRLPAAKLPWLACDGW